MTPFQAIDAFHTPDTLISPGQAFAIGSAIAASGEKPNVLVFGCGNDTALWCAMNENGYVLFLENNAGWLERTRQHRTYRLWRHYRGHEPADLRG
jgi:hypothetical protein